MPRLKYVCIIRLCLQNALEEKFQDSTAKLQVQLNLNKSAEKLSEKITNIKLENVSVTVLYGNKILYVYRLD